MGGREVPRSGAARRPLAVGLLSQSRPGQPACGGIGRYTFDLARGLHERGHEVHVFCRDERRLRQEGPGFFVHGIGLGDLGFAGDVGDRPVLRKNLAYGAAVERRIRELELDGADLDLVHASNWDAEGLGVIRSGRHPTVLMLVTPLAQVIEAEHWAVDDDLRACVGLDGWQIRHADAVCTPSAGVWASYERLMGIRPEDVTRRHVVPLGIVPDLAASTAAGEALPRRLLFVGRCERRKGVDVLLDVLPGLLARFPEWICDLVGDDQQAVPEGGTLKEAFLARHGGAAWLSRVRFRGVVDETALRAAYRECDLFVAPSRFESFGLIYFEAMQYGKAVVGCRTGGVPEVVRDGVDGVLVEPGSAPALGEALAKLMADDALRRRMGEAARSRVRGELDYRRMAERMEAVYLDTVRAAGDRRRAERSRMRPVAQPLSALAWSGPWEQRERSGGVSYRVGAAGAELRVSARPGTVLQLVVWCDSASGILEIRAGSAVLGFVDCWGREPARDQIRRIVLPERPASGAIVLRVHAERNAASSASEVWIRGLWACPADDPDRPASRPL